MPTPEQVADFLRSAIEDSEWNRECRDAAIRAVLAQSDKPLLPFAIIVEGGLIQDVVSSDPRLVGIKYVTIDYDTEGLSGADLITDVPQGGKDETAEAYVCHHEITESAIDLSKTDDWTSQTVEKLIEEMEGR